jgi:Tol biopolymer transport system component
MSEDMSRLDDILEPIIRDRAGKDIPLDLRGQIMAAIRETGDVQPRRLRALPATRPGRGVTLLAAAILVAAAVGIAASAGSQAVRRSPDASIAVNAPVSSSVTPFPSLVIPCTPMEDASRIGGLGNGPDPASGAAPATLRNGDLLVAGASQSDVARVSPSDVKALLHPVMSFGLQSFAISELAASPDGTVIAADLGFKGVDGCQDVFVFGSGGGSLRRPFAVEAGQSVTSPRWAPDGRALAVVTESHARASQQPGPTSIDLWNAVTGSLTHLGTPCDGCAISGPPAWSPSGGSIATLNGIQTPGVAVVTPNGQWRIVISGEQLQPPSDQLSQNVTLGSTTLLGWVDDNTVLLLVDDQVARLTVGAPTELRFTGVRVALASTILSPDGTKVAGPTFTGNTMDGVAVIDLATGPIRAIWKGNVDLLDVYWAPDSKAIVFQASLMNGDRGVWVANADGSGVRRILTGSFGVMTWLPTAG